MHGSRSRHFDVSHSTKGLSGQKFHIFEDLFHTAFQDAILSGASVATTGYTRASSLLPAV
jgi:hypothetical protein